MFGEDRPFVRRDPIPGLDGKHICGTRDEHERGELLDVTRPPNKYAPSGIPLCCAPGRREAVLLVGVGVSSRVVRGRTYRRYVCACASVRSVTIRTRPYRSRVCICPDAIVSRTIRSDPYRSAVCACAGPVSRTIRSDPYRSIVRVAVTPESYYVRPGAWSRTVPGEYEFTAIYTGPHLIECIAGGGAGGLSEGGGGMGLGGGGGGGGGANSAIYDLVEGVTYFVIVGAGGLQGVRPGGDTGFAVGTLVEVQAAGGGNGVGHVAGTGGIPPAVLGQISWEGGDGADGSPTGEGGGGGAGARTVRVSPPVGTGDSATGRPGATGTGGVFTGDGGDGGFSMGAGSDGSPFGGGGGGAGLDGVPGEGAGGAVFVTWPWTGA